MENTDLIERFERLLVQRQLMEERLCRLVEQLNDNLNAVALTAWIAQNPKDDELRDARKAMRLWKTLATHKS